MAMNDAQTMLTFFYGLFWAASLSAAGKYNAFALHKNRLRWLVAFLVMNVLPALYFAYLFFYVFGNTCDLTGWTFSVLIVSALSVFGFNRMLYAIILTKWWMRFYVKDEKDEITENIKCCLKPEQFGPHFIWGGLYVLVGFVSSILYYLFDTYGCKVLVQCLPC